MKLGVPTVYADCLCAQEVVGESGRQYKVGEIIRLPYGPALQLRAVGAVSAFVDEQSKHVEAVEQLAVYGGDCWFPNSQQSCARILEYLNNPQGSC